MALGAKRNYAMRREACTSDLGLNPESIAVAVKIDVWLRGCFLWGDDYPRSMRTGDDAARSWFLVPSVVFFIFCKAGEAWLKFVGKCPRHRSCNFYPACSYNYHYQHITEWWSVYIPASWSIAIHVLLLYMIDDYGVVGRGQRDTAPRCWSYI